MSITKSQAREIALGKNLEGDFNLEDNKLIDLKDVTLSFFEKYAAIYLLAISESIKKNEVVGSGKM